MTVPVDTSTILLQIGLILIVARLFGELAAFLVANVLQAIRKTD